MAKIVTNMQDMRMDAKERQYVLALPDNAVPGYWTAGLGSGTHAWSAIMRESLQQATTPGQRITFLAKRLLSEKDGSGHSITLATPLYVAQAD